MRTEEVAPVESVLTGINRKERIPTGTPTDIRLHRQHIFRCIQCVKRCCSWSRRRVKEEVNDVVVCGVAFLWQCRDARRKSMMCDMRHPNRHHHGVCVAVEEMSTWYPMKLPRDWWILCIIDSRTRHHHHSCCYVEALWRQKKPQFNLMASSFWTLSAAKNGIDKNASQWSQLGKGQLPTPRAYLSLWYVAFQLADVYVQVAQDDFGGHPVLFILQW